MADKAKKKRVGPITFFRQVRAEGNKVTWTSRQETIQATIFVVIMSIQTQRFLERPWLWTRLSAQNPPSHQRLSGPSLTGRGVPTRAVDLPTDLSELCWS